MHLMIKINKLTLCNYENVFGFSRLVKNLYLRNVCTYVCYVCAKNYRPVFRTHVKMLSWSSANVSQLSQTLIMRRLDFGQNVSNLYHETENVFCWMSNYVRFLSDGYQMGIRWVSDGYQMGIRWVSDSCSKI